MAGAVADIQNRLPFLATHLFCRSTSTSSQASSIKNIIQVLLGQSPVAIPLIRISQHGMGARLPNWVCISAELQDVNIHIMANTHTGSIC